MLYFGSTYLRLRLGIKNTVSQVMTSLEITDFFLSPSNTTSVCYHFADRRCFPPSTAMTPYDFLSPPSHSLPNPAPSPFSCFSPSLKYTHTRARAKHLSDKMAEDVKSSERNEMCESGVSNRVKNPFMVKKHEPCRPVRPHLKWMSNLSTSQKNDNIHHKHLARELHSWQLLKDCQRAIKRVPL